MNILIAEDEERMRRLVKDFLVKEGYNVLEAADGQEAMDILETKMGQLSFFGNKDISLIILDVMMPHYDGWSLLRHIRKKDTNLPVIMLTARSEDSDEVFGLELGASDYITKPFSATYLKTRIASLHRQRKSLQEIYMAKLTEGKEIAVAEALTPSQPQITPYDEQFMQKVMEFIEEQMDNAELTIDEFAEHLMLSRTIFYRKLKSIIGLTPVDFIREVRIKRAAQLIDSGEYNFSQVAYLTGFNDPKYFSKCFKKVVGITPSEYKEKNK